MESCDRKYNEFLEKYGNKLPVVNIASGTGCDCKNCETDCMLKDLELGGKRKYVKQDTTQDKLM